MNIKRALAFSLLLYFGSFLVFWLLFLFMGISVESTLGLREYIYTWVLYIPLVLFLAKWYFRTSAPTTKHGFQLGLMAIAVALLIDGLSVLGTMAAAQPLDMFAEMYSDWKFYASIVWVILLTTYAGFEFDGTYTVPLSPEKKEE